MSHDQRVVFGVGPVRELLRARPSAIAKLLVSSARAARAKRGGNDPVADLAADAQQAGIAVESASKESLSRLVGPGDRHQGVVALAKPYEYADVDDILAVARDRDEPPLVVVLDGVTDPHNFGAIARSAYLLGAHGVVVAKDRAAAVNAVSTKSSAGATEVLAIAQVTNIARAIGELKRAGLWIAAIAGDDDAIPIGDLDATGPLALVMGSEGSGLRKLVAQQCDYQVVIPMAGAAVGSFNVSVATAIALYEVSRQRSSGGEG